MKKLQVGGGTSLPMGGPEWPRPFLRSGSWLCRRTHTPRPHLGGGRLSAGHCRLPGDDRPSALLPEVSRLRSPRRDKCGEQTPVSTCQPVRGGGGAADASTFARQHVNLKSILCAPQKVLETHRQCLLCQLPPLSHLTWSGLSRPLSCMTSEVNDGYVSPRPGVCL